MKHWTGKENLHRQQRDEQGWNENTHRFHTAHRSEVVLRALSSVLSLKTTRITVVRNQTTHLIYTREIDIFAFHIDHVECRERPLLDGGEPAVLCVCAIQLGGPCIAINVPPHVPHGTSASPDYSHSLFPAVVGRAFRRRWRSLTPS